MIKRMFKWLFDLMSSPSFIYIFVLNLVANSLSYVYFKDSIACVSFVLLSAIITFFEIVLVNAFSRITWLKQLLFYSVIIFSNVLILTDIFLIKEFNLLFGEDVINIIADTNTTEASNFISTYFSLSNITIIIGLIIGINLVALLCSRLFSKVKYIGVINVILCIGGILLSGYCIYNQKVYGSGLGIPQYSAVTRYAHSGYLLNRRGQEIIKLQKVCQNVNAISTVTDDRKIILVIGESYSIYHSSLYNYDLPTTPLLNNLKEKGEIFVFENAITPFNATHATMEEIFSTKEFSTSPLFPCCFKKAGYFTHLSENQYSLGSSLNFLSDEILSNLMFSERIDYMGGNDEKLIDSLCIDKGPALYILHLQGQHYAYENRYPKEFRKFTKNDYNSQRWDDSQREIIAHYDNATLYNDYVINKLINKCRDLNACVIYISDHGEEIYDVRNYMGHGDAKGSKESLLRQIRIPFIIYVSEQFKNNNKNIVDKMGADLNIPISTKDISHFLMGLSGVYCDDYNPTRDFLNEKYNRNKHRIVLKSIDYDTLVY